MTQMATETIIETVVDDLTDHEFETCCDLGDWYAGECDRPARWVAIKVCCGGAVCMCDECKEIRLGEGFDDQGVECASCGAVHVPSRTAYLYIEPLRKS